MLNVGEIILSAQVVIVIKHAAKTLQLLVLCEICVCVKKIRPPPPPRPGIKNVCPLSTIFLEFSLQEAFVQLAETIL